MYHLFWCCRGLLVCSLSSVIQWHRVRHKATVHAEMMTGLRLVLGMWGLSTWEFLVSFRFIKALISITFIKKFAHIICKGDIGWSWITIMIHREFFAWDVMHPMFGWCDVSVSCFTQMHVCPHTCLFKLPPLPCSVSVFSFSHSASFFSFWMFCSFIVIVECLFVVPPGLCPLSPCRAWRESAMRGSTGINLGNLISGAVIPALNISISLGWLAVLELDLWWPATGEEGEEGGREAGGM